MRLNAGIICDMDDDIIVSNAQFVRLNSVNLHLLRGKKKVENDY